MGRGYCRYRSDMKIFWLKSTGHVARIKATLGLISTAISESWDWKKEKELDSHP